MRHVIFGAVGVLWGGAILLYAAFGAPRGEGAFGAGQLAGTLFGVVMFAAGLYYLIDGIRGTGSDDEPRERPRKKKKRKPRRDEDDE